MAKTKTTTTPPFTPSGTLSVKNVRNVLGAMQDNNGDIDTYAVTKIVYGKGVLARNYRFATGNFMARLERHGWVRWSMNETKYRGSIVGYILTPKGKKLLETLKP